MAQSMAEPFNFPLEALPTQAVEMTAPKRSSFSTGSASKGTAIARGDSLDLFGRNSQESLQDDDEANALRRWHLEQVLLEKYAWLIFPMKAGSLICGGIQWVFLVRMMFYWAQAQSEECQTKSDLLDWTWAVAAFKILGLVLDYNTRYGTIQDRILCCHRGADDEMEDRIPCRIQFVQYARSAVFFGLLVYGLLLVYYFRQGQHCPVAFDTAIRDFTVSGLIFMVADAANNFILHAIFERELKEREQNRFQTKPEEISFSPEVRVPIPEDMVVPDNCAVCNKAFVEHDWVAMTDCKHFFHGRCLKLRLQVSTRCPLCNNDLIVKTPHAP